MNLWEILNEKAAIDTTVKDIVEKMSSMQRSYNSDLGDFLKYMVSYIRPWATKDGLYDELSHIVKDNKIQGHRSNYQVRILTMQSAKGLEAELVFVIGLEDGHLPRRTAQQEVAEDARLMFVAMTRAKDQLHLFHSRKRDGSVTFIRESHSLAKSPFISCLPNDQVKKQYHPAKNK